MIHWVSRPIVGFQLYHFEMIGKWLLHDPDAERWVGVETKLIILIWGLIA